MTLRNKILLGAFSVLAIGASSLGYLFSHNAACASASALAHDEQTIKAIVRRCYGGPEVLAYENIPKPTPADDEVLIKVRAAGLNPLDFHYLRGTPYLVRTDSGFGKPTNPRLGVDFSGTVEAVGKSVTRYKPGDAVFGGKYGALAEYVTVREAGALAFKPDNVTFEQAAATPIAAVTALQALRDKAHLQAGQKVLINGASGGVGTFAVQIAKAFGADVTGVCSTRNMQLVQMLGANRVIDYTHEDYTQIAERYDVIIDTVGNHSLADNRRVLAPHGALVIVGGGTGNWIGPMIEPLKAAALAPFVDQKLSMILSELNAKDLDSLREMLQTGKVAPLIDRRYALSEVPQAIGYLEQGHARGKVVVSVP